MIKTILILLSFILPLSFWGQNFKNRSIVGEDSAKLMLANILNDANNKLPSDTLIKDKETAISIAETILFKTYGKATITTEKPYECYLVDGYWFLRGTLPKSYTGDVFELIMSAKDAKIIKISHGSR